jgi:hypothetical protein
MRNTKIAALLVTGLVLGLSVQNLNIPSTHAQDTGVKRPLVEPRRIRIPKIATQRSTRENPNCPCPYDVAFDRKTCGGRSAYAKPGGDEPACYVGETTARQLWWNSPYNQFVDRQRTGQ